MTVDADTFRGVLGQWPSGVTVVTTLADGVPHGMTASSFTSVSLDPPLISVAIARHVHSHDLITASGIFAVNILGKDQVEHGKRFAGMLDLEDRFEGVETAAGPTGAPLLRGALGWLDCKVWAAYDGGDHTIFVGEVLDAGADAETAPLLYHARSWGQVADVLPTRATVTVTDATRASDGAGRVLVPADALPLDPSRRGHVIARVTSAAQIERAKVQGARAVELPVDVATPQRLVRLAHDLGLPVRIALGSVFGEAEGPRTPEAVVADVQRGLALSPDELVLDDGNAAADPVLVREVLQRAGPIAGPTPLALRAGAGPMALANVLTALKSGVRHLDAAVDEGRYVGALSLVEMLTRMRVDCGLAPDTLAALRTPT